jgi:lipoprotein-anchoring transpeptidase ErfK/SrfK
LPTREKVKIFVAAVSVFVVAFGAIFYLSARPKPQVDVPVQTPEEATRPPASADTSRPGDSAAARPASADLLDRGAEEREIERSLSNGTYIVVHKGRHALEVFQNGRAIKRYGIAVGKNFGDKRSVGDMRTPEGEFPIVQIQNSSGWTHDFRDGRGQIRGAYGPYFIRLGTPGWSGIGIHGTHAPDSIGTDVTEGCIRLNNDDLLELRKIVKIGDRVAIRR